MVSITNANNKKACCIDPITRKVEVVSKGYKVAIEFLSDGRIEVVSFYQDGTIADKHYIPSPR